MLKILKYSYYDLARSKWSYFYFLFYLLLGFLLLFLNNDLSKAIITLLNLVVILVPLIGTIFGVMYFYNSREFTTLLLAQPIKRSHIFTGQFLGVGGTLTLCLVLGLGIPFMAYGLIRTDAIWDFTLLLVVGAFLTLIFTALSFNVALANSNRIKGFGFAVLLWLFLAVIYDGLFLVSLLVFEEYPLDVFALIGTAINPIDLSRILILLKLDISVLLGYTGAIFKSFLGSHKGFLVAMLILIVWVIVPLRLMIWQGNRKDF